MTNSTSPTLTLWLSRTRTSITTPETSGVTCTTLARTRASRVHGLSSLVRHRNQPATAATASASRVTERRRSGRRSDIQYFQSNRFQLKRRDNHDAEQNDVEGGIEQRRMTDKTIEVGARQRKAQHKPDHTRRKRISHQRRQQHAGKVDFLDHAVTASICGGVSGAGWPKKTACRFISMSIL